MSRASDIQRVTDHNARIGGTRAISYGGLELLAPVRDIRQAVEDLPTRDRRKVMASVNASLARSFPRVKSGKASRKEAMECASDIVLWFANEVIEGRAQVEEVRQ